MTRLCEDCRAARERWICDSGNVLLYLRQPGIRITEFATYDGTPEGIAGRRRAKFEEYRQLVNRQVALINDICARKHQVAPGIVPLPVPGPGGQYDLLAVAS